MAYAWFPALRFRPCVSVSVTVSVIRVLTAVPYSAVAVSVPCTHHGPNGNGKIELDPIWTDERKRNAGNQALFSSKKTALGWHSNDSRQSDAHQLRRQSLL